MACKECGNNQFYWNKREQKNQCSNCKNLTSKKKERAERSLFSDSTDNKKGDE